MNGITKDSKHSYTDFGLILSSRSFPPSEKKKITVEVPFCNTVYDFSKLYNNTQFYNQRTLTYVFIAMVDDIQLLSTKVQAVVNWLYSGGKTNIYDDRIADYHFSAECIKVATENVNPFTCQITAEFTAYPYMINNTDSSEVL